jgi:hypothetical protein
MGKGVSAKHRDVENGVLEQNQGLVRGTCFVYTGK